ncbi:hypothetical protein DNC80_04985 [Flavobacterium sp. SOK18b]|nr:hypothetical protein [Flavobacterium sp. SOK18b]
MNYLIIGKIMKKLIIIILFSVWSCVPDTEKSYDYSIINTSGVNVELIPYVDGVKKMDDRMILQNNQVYNKKYTAYGAGGYNMSSLLQNLTKAPGSVTHLEIIFNTAKKVVYQECTATNQCFNQARNIFNPVFSADQTEVYTITPEDFQNAQDCGGNCN